MSIQSRGRKGGRRESLWVLSVPNYISVYAVGVEIMNHCSFLCFVVVIVCFVFFNGFMVHLSTFLTQMFGVFSHHRTVNVIFVMRRGQRGLSVDKSWWAEANQIGLRATDHDISHDDGGKWKKETKTQEIQQRCCD